MWTVDFWKAAGERALKTFAQVWAAVLAGPAVGDVIGVDLLHVGWRDSVSFAAGAALLSLLASIASAQIGPKGSPSVVEDPAAAEAPAVEGP